MAIAFYGNVYADTDTATGDSGRRFETSEKKLTRCIIQVTDEGQNFGTESVYPLYIAADGKFELVNVDISKLYFANATPGANGTVSILGVEAE